MERKVAATIAILFFFLFLGFAFSDNQQKEVFKKVSPKEIYAARKVISCSPDWSQINADSLGKSMKPLSGWGNFRWSINTKSDSAAFYFNQGINMYYSFHIIEAMASFKKAALFDDKNPMIYWAQALAYGPNINDYAYAATPDAYAAASNASTLSSGAGKLEKALIAAMLVRYSNDSTISRKTLNQLYADAMKNVFRQFRNNANAGTLYADALMLQHPWEYWKHDGMPQAWTPEIISVLEHVLKQHPNHPGANHYYIHAVEASPNPGMALSSADRLGKMMPDVSHMVHMPSHIYIRTGHYKKGIEVNDLSLNGYNKYLSMYPDVVNNAFLYAIHNHHMKAACAMMRPNYAMAIKASKECVASFDHSFLSLPQPMGNFIQYVFMTPQMANVRYGKWNEILSAEEISAEYVFGYILQQWAKGMAFANSNRLAEATAALSLIRGKINHTDMQVRLEPFNKPADQALVAIKILEGTILVKENKLPDAISILREAVVDEDRLIYTEPRDWLIPARHYLADALMRYGKNKEAKKYLAEDLQINPHNFYAVWAMKEIAKNEHDLKNQKKYEKEWRQVNENSDLTNGALIY